MLTKECTVKYSNISHLFTSSALVLRPFPGSPLHRSQNLSSSFFNSLGFRPDNEAPGTSSSVKTATFVEVVGMSAMYVRVFPRGLSSLALMLVVTIPSERSAIYESRVSSAELQR